MDNLTIVSYAALIVSILALPTSYFVATKQVKIGLDEFERRTKERTRLIVADRLEELASVFFSAAEVLSGIDKKLLIADPKKIEPHISEIEKLVIGTGIIDRIAKAIDEYTEISVPDLAKDGEISTKIKMIRGMANPGYQSSERYVAWNILNVCEGNTLPSILKKQKS